MLSIRTIQRNHPPLRAGLAWLVFAALLAAGAVMPRAAACDAVEPSSPPKILETVETTPVDPPWVDLFDGETLKGWVQRGGKADYVAEDGVIVGSTVPNTPNSFLCTEKHYENFILELDVMVDSRLNSGIQIRSNSFPDYHDGRVHGYQVEIDPSDRAWSAGIYDEGRRGWLADLKNNEPARKAFRRNEWNHYRISAIGNTMQTWINGVPAAHLEDSLTSSGFIALQVHGTNSTETLQVMWRNIKLRELGPGLGTTRDVLGRAKSTMGAAAPDEADMLIGPRVGSNPWVMEKDGRSPVAWLFGDGVLTVEPGSGSIVTRRDVRDFILHLEFQVPEVKGARGTQNAGNSGVYIQQRYELQILDSFGLEPGLQDCGALYKAKVPDVNACRKPGEWQTYDIVFRAARWDLLGKKVEDVRVSVLQNGELIHDNARLENKTGAGNAEGPDARPIRLQDHGSPVKFRNTWIVDLPPTTIPERLSATEETVEEARREDVRAHSLLRLAEAVARSEGPERDKALTALKGIDGPWVSGALIRGLRESRGATRTVMVEQAAARQLHAVAPDLLRLAGDGAADATERRAALDGLGALARQTDLGQMAKFLSEAENLGELRPAAEAALVSACRRLDNPDRAAAFLMVPMAQARTPEARRSLARVLKEIGGARAEAALRETLEDK